MGSDVIDCSWHLSLGSLEQDEVFSRPKSLSLVVSFCIFMVTEPVTVKNSK